LKYILVLLVVVGGLWMWLRRRDASNAADRSAAPAPAPAPAKGKAPAAQAMLACAHCGVHLPQTEAQMDAAGRPFCSEAHRLAGPR
jgi:uncharacterized protein